MSTASPTITATPWTWIDPTTLPYLARPPVQSAFDDDIPEDVVDAIFDTWEASRAARDAEDAAKAAAGDEPQQGDATADQTDGTGDATRQTDDHSGEPKEEPANGDQKSSIIRVRKLRLRGTNNIPRRETLYGRRLFRKYVTVTVAPGGVGKTKLAVVDSLSMAAGRPLLGHLVEQPLNVWFVNAEDPIEEVERAFEAAAAHHRVTEAAIGDRITISSGRDSQFVLFNDEGRGRLKLVEPVAEAILEHAFRERIDVMIVDPFVSTHTVNENDNVAIQRVAQAWVDIAEATGMGIELVHHSAKTQGEITADHSRGAGALVNKSRSTRVLNRLTFEEAEKWGVPAEDRKGYFRADIDKANLTKAGGASEWYRFVSYPMGNGVSPSKPQDHEGVVERWYPPTAEEEAEEAAEKQKNLQAELVASITPEKLQDIKNVLAGGGYKRNAQARNWAGNVVAGAAGLDVDEPDAKKRVAALLDALIAAGELVEVMRSDTHRKFTPHVEPAAAP